MTQDHDYYCWDCMERVQKSEISNHENCELQQKDWQEGESIGDFREM